MKFALDSPLKEQTSDFERTEFVQNRKSGSSELPKIVFHFRKFALDPSIQRADFVFRLQTPQLKQEIGSQKTLTFLLGRPKRCPKVAISSLPGDRSVMDGDCGP